jgi:aminoglycoside phosphotransferase (APT) family kinase protein
MADGIARVDVHRRKKLLYSFVAKPFADETSRELHVYRLLTSTRQFAHLLPALLGWMFTGRNRGYTFLEWVPAEHPWPWQDLRSSSAVLEELAELHSCDPSENVHHAAANWDYEQELTESAHRTLAEYRRLFASNGGRPGNRPMLRALERLLAALPKVRRELLAFTGTALLHGDVHTGNVILTSCDANPRPVFIDWARARLGSPLEDVASWVHSLGLWEPEVRRRHDTLLKCYLAARGSSMKLSGSFREACILAGACNALAGALRYHLSVIECCGGEESYRAAADWLRIVRRADMCLRS